MARTLRWLAGEVARIENSSLPAWYFLLTFLSAATLRTFLELFTDRSAGEPAFSHFFALLSGGSDGSMAGMLAHYTLFYAALALSLILLLKALTREGLLPLARLTSAGFFVLLLVPAVDFVATTGAGYDLSYLVPGDGNFFALFFTFFGPLTGTGISLGMRVEIALAVGAALLFFLHKGYGALRSVLLAVCVYAVIFIYVAMPYLTDPLFAFLGALQQNSNMAGVRFFGLLVALQLLAAARVHAPGLMRALARDLRYPRLMHYWAMFLFGIFLSAMAGPVRFDTETALSVPLMLIAIAAAWAFSVITNNLADADIDRISNPGRPLVSGAVEGRVYGYCALGALFLALSCAALAGAAAFFMVGVFLASYFLYSMPPLRLKRAPYFSKLAILINSGALLTAGFAAMTLLTGAGAAVFVSGLFSSLPAALMCALPCVLLLAANFIDLKDYAGDKAAGIPTLPVLFGMRASQLLIGGAFLFLYASISMLLFDGFLAAAGVLLGLAQFYLLNKKEYREAPVFALYLATLAGLFLSFL